MRAALVLGTLAATALLAVACGGGDDDGGTASDSGTSSSTGAGASKAGGGTPVSVTLSEWEVKPSPASVKAGSVTFTAKNSGTQQHELVIVQTDLDPASLPIAAGVVDETKVKIVDEIEPFDAGKTEAGTFTLAAGKYVLLCNVAGHYQLGMHEPFTVE